MESLARVSRAASTGPFLGDRVWPVARTLQQVHASTHPAAMLGRSATASRAADRAAESLFQTLASEAEDDGETT